MLYYKRLNETVESYFFSVKIIIIHRCFIIFLNKKHYFRGNLLFTTNLKKEQEKKIKKTATIGLPKVCESVTDWDIKRGRSGNQVESYPR